MKSIIPYSKEISFGSKIAEITSMSLEHEIQIEPDCASGNFIISGDYKSHEVSVNREPFLFKLPFSIELTESIDLDSLRFEIRDFSYDIVNDETIEVDIEFSIEAEEIVEEEPKEEEIVERGTLEKVDDPVITPEISNLVDEHVIMEQESEETYVEPEEAKDEVAEREVILKQETEMMEEKVEDMQKSEETIIQTVNPMDESYATYHIHVVNNGETVETICTMYHSNLNLLSEYNDMGNISVGDKIIIPKEDE